MEEYAPGGVADLLAGTLTPSRPASSVRAHTPVKHQPSPHVTPRGDPTGSRDALLSPSVLRRKAIVKKSPKRIFDQPDLNNTADGENSTKSPKADKVKKHLQAQMDNESVAVKGSDGKVKTPKRKLDSSSTNDLAKKLKNNTDISSSIAQGEETNVVLKKKKKKKKKSKANASNNAEVQAQKIELPQSDKSDKPVGKKNKKNKKNIENKQKEASDHSNAEANAADIPNDGAAQKGKKRKNKKKNKNKQKLENTENGGAKELVKEKLRKDSSSDHASDNDIESETEQDVKKILDNGPIQDEESSDDEDKNERKKPAKPSQDKPKSEKPEKYVMGEDEIKRTLFVGNVPISKKCKKEIKKIFSKYGDIESVRIRTVPVKDMRTTPKVALIKNEIHPERTSVNVYVKFVNESSVGKALSENNRQMGEHHLRVTRSDTSGEFHDPRKTVFVGNIPFGIEDEVLRRTLEKCGEIDSVRIIRDKSSQIGKGFGYVNFASSDGVELALTLSEEDLTIKNRIIRLRRYAQAPKGQKVKGKLPPKSNQWNKSSKNSLNVKDSGALKRINNKRKFQENPVAVNSGPPQKKNKTLDQPVKEKKSKKEFVGLTAEKKKKKKFNKGQKNKKKLSEILTKS